MRRRLAGIRVILLLNAIGFGAAIGIAIAIATGAISGGVADV